MKAAVIVGNQGAKPLDLDVATRKLLGVNSTHLRKASDMLGLSLSRAGLESGELLFAVLAPRLLTIEQLENRGLRLLLRSQPPGEPVVEGEHRLGRREGPAGAFERRGESFEARFCASSTSDFPAEFGLAAVGLCLERRASDLARVPLTVCRFELGPEARDLLVSFCCSRDLSAELDAQPLQGCVVAVLFSRLGRLGVPEPLGEGPSAPPFLPGPANGPTPTGSLAIDLFLGILQRSPGRCAGRLGTVSVGGGPSRSGLCRLPEGRSPIGRRVGTDQAVDGASKLRPVHLWLQQIRVGVDLELLVKLEIRAAHGCGAQNHGYRPRGGPDLGAQGEAQAVRFFDLQENETGGDLLDSKRKLFRRHRFGLDSPNRQRRADLRFEGPTPFNDDGGLTHDPLGRYMNYETSQTRGCRRYSHRRAAATLKEK